MILYIAIVGSIAAAASVARLIVAIADYRRNWPKPSTESLATTPWSPQDQITVRPDGSWTRPSGWRNR